MTSPPSFAESIGMDVRREAEQTPQATQLESLLLLALGTLKVWLVLAVGATAGYALTFAVAWIEGSCIGSFPWNRLLSRGLIEFVVMFAMGGWLIEALRVQG